MPSKILDLSGNQLQSLPENIGCLRNLYTLNLGRNQLRSLPESLGQLHNLHTLHLSENLLKTVPDTLDQLHPLHILDLGDNPLSLASLVCILHLVQTNPNLNLDYPSDLLKHPLIQPLSFQSLKCLSQPCPFCGASETVTGQIKNTQ
ncbi:MAG: leucine-rich repeat domain-containing protein [Candidatus Hodarchaeota archaeon]